MPEAHDDRLTFTALHTSPLIKVADYRCTFDRSGPTGEEYAQSNDIVLMRHGAFCRHIGSHSATHDVNQSVFFSKGSTYRISHPSECGDRGTVFVIAPRVLNDIVRELDASIDEHPEKPFNFSSASCNQEIFASHRRLIQRLEKRHIEPLEHLWADESALQLMANVLEAAFDNVGARCKPKRKNTDVSHAEQVEAAKSYLTEHLGERVTLDDVALAVHSSPFHLARVFQKRTGISLHRYLTQLRLRSALEDLCASQGNDLTSLALKFGFSSHSHFAEAFHKEFGSSPSVARKNGSTRKFREMSKILIV